MREKTNENYNGWTNRETWATKLHWDNNSPTQEYYLEKAKEFKKIKYGLFEFANFLKEQAEEIYYEVLQSNFENKKNEEFRMFILDVGSLWRVNWHEIAQAYFNEVSE